MTLEQEDRLFDRRHARQNFIEAMKTLAAGLWAVLWFGVGCLVSCAVVVWAWHTVFGSGS